MAATEAADHQQAIRSSPHALSLIEADFSDGGLRRDSCIRIGKLFNANQVLILGIVDHLTRSKLAEIISRIIEIFSPVLEGDTP